MNPPALNELLTDPSVTDICVQGTHSLTFRRAQMWEQRAAPWESSEAVMEWVLKALAAAGKSWDARHPFCDFVLQPHHRAHAVFPPIAGHGVALSLRRLGAAQPGAKRTWEPERLWARARVCFAQHRNMLICGATGSGKTTLLGDLLEAASGGERVIAIEDTPELFPRIPHFVSLRARTTNADDRGEVTQRTLVRQALRMRPDRIILGECRGDEILDVLTAANTGHRGVAFTLHANSAREALHRIELLAHLAYPSGLPEHALKQWIRYAFDDVLFLEGYRIREAAEIAGFEGSAWLLRPWS